MSGEQRFSFQQASVVAGILQHSLEPFCDRIEIAGSLRRLKSGVGDIELLCIPKPTENLFFTDALDEALKARLADGSLFLRPAKNGVTTYGPKNKLLVHMISGIPLDIFSTTAENWGMALLVRTGSADFNIRVMSRFKELGYQGHAYGGITLRNGNEVECPDEETVFKYLNWDYIAPEKRV